MNPSVFCKWVHGEFCKNKVKKNKKSLNHSACPEIIDCRYAFIQLAKVRPRHRKMHFILIMNKCQKVRSKKK